MATRLTQTAPGALLTPGARRLRLSFLIPAVLLPIALSGQQPTVAGFVEFGGSGGFASANLEVAPFRQIRLRGGGGFLWVWPTIPLSGSILMGRGKSKLELGAGGTVIFFPGTDSSHDDFAQRLGDLLFFGKGIGTRVIGAGILGYRYQPDEGAILRFAFTPFVSNGKVAPWGGVSIG